jgi:alpha-ribazole phosphatase
MKLYLVRHAATEGNRAGRYIGWEDMPLSPEGSRQAQALALRLAETPLTSIRTSDLARAAATANVIAAAHGLMPILEPALREVNFGEWSGLTYEEIDRIAPELLRNWIDDPEHFAPPGGESLDQLRRRALAALPRVDGALVVSHGGTLRTILSQLLGCPFWDLRIPPASLTVLDWDGEHAIRSGPVGDTSHVEGERCRTGPHTG